MTDRDLIISQIRQRLEILYQEVARLETGGGGGGGTDNYNELENKPKINNVTLSGNKTGSDLGLASTSDVNTAIGTAIADLDVAEVGGSTYFLTTIKEVDGKIDADAVAQSTILSDYLTTSTAASTYQTQSGMSNYYTKTEVGGEIVGAINDLDVPAVGGSTKYITTISEANGLIDASAELPDTVPTTDSSKLITSGGVKTYVDNGLSNKLILSDVFGVGVSLSGQTSLDNLTPGNYYASDGTVAAAVSAPYTRSGFNLWVIATTSATRKVQLLFPNPYLGEYNTYNFFYMRQNISNNWGDWTVISNGLGLGGVIKLQNGDNLNDCTAPGVYLCQTSSVCQNLVSTSIPFDGSTTYPYLAFKLKVEYINSENNIRQTIIPLDDTSSYYIRVRMTGATGTWKSWYQFSGTQMAAPAAQQLSGNELRGAVEEERGEDSPIEEEPEGDER